MKKKIVALMRISNEIQRVDFQRNAISQYGKKSNIIIDEWLEEISLCGSKTKIKNKKVLMKIKEMAENGELEQVITLSMDRISRNALEVIDYIKYLNGYGVKIISIMEGHLDDRERLKMENFIKVENLIKECMEKEMKYKIGRRISEGKKRVKQNRIK